MTSGGKLVFVAVVGIGLLALMSFVTLLVLLPAGGQPGTQEFSYQATPSQGANFTLSVSNVNGAIDLFQWSGQYVLVNGTISSTGWGASPSDVELVPSASGSGMSLKVVLPGNGFFFGRQYDVPIKVFVPQSLTLGSLHLETVNGALDLQGGTRSHSTTLSTVNGQISFGGIAGGSLTVTTVNGGITGRLEQVAQGTTYSFSTTNGEAQLTVPREASFGLSMQNLNGEISTSGLAAMSVSQSTGHRLTATVGSQGATAQISMETINGDLGLAGD